MKIVFRVAVSLLAALVVLVVMAVYAFGPTYVPMITGKPIFLFGASTERVNKAMVWQAGARGLYSDSPEFAAARQAFEADPGNEELLLDAIKAAGGKHSTVFTAKEEQAQESIPPRVELRDNVVWAEIPQVSRLDDVQGYADAVAGGIVKQQRACAAVVDLRGNGGGDMGPMLAGLSPLLPDGVVLSFVSALGTTDVIINGNSIQGGGTPVATRGGKLDVPVAVLVDGQTASSGEAAMLAFRGLDNSRSFGEPTAGYASANVVVDYPDGRSLMLTTSKDRARTGEEFAEDPVQPDAPLSDLDGWLAQRCG